MQKQPFDETGLQNLLLELYALPDLELSEHAYALRNQPKLWISGHFELDTAQLQFLQDLPSSAANFLGQQGSFAMENRLPIALNKSQQYRVDGEPKQDKLFKTISSLYVASDNNAQATPGGELHLEVTYFEEP